PAPGASQEADDERTRVISLPAAGARVSTPSPGEPPGVGGGSPPDDRTPVLAASPLATPRPAPGPPRADHPLPRPPAAPGPPARTGAQRVRGPSGSWGRRVVLLVMLLPVVVSCLTALSVKLWSDRRLDATAEARATALARWLAADASLALRAGV